MGLVSYFMGRHLIKFVSESADRYTQATSAEKMGGHYNPKQHAAYALIGENVKQIIKLNPKELWSYVAHNCMNTDVSVGVYALTLLYHDTVYTELRSGKYHSTKGVLDKDGLGPYLVEAIEGIIDLAVEYNVYPGKSKEEMMHSIEFAIDTSPSASDTDDAMLMAKDLIHRRY